MADIALLDRIIEQIEQHPETWDQATWERETECGTAYCVAGHAVAMTIGPITHYSPWNAEYVTADGVIGSWSVTARDALDLTARQAHVLFHPSNTLGEIKTMRDLLAADVADQLEYWTL